MKHKNLEKQHEQANLIKVDGFQQVVELLLSADEDFRESLLQRISERDSNLARSLRIDVEQYLEA